MAFFNVLISAPDMAFPHSLDVPAWAADQAATKAAKAAILMDTLGPGIEFAGLPLNAKPEGFEMPYEDRVRFANTPAACAHVALSATVITL